jgi:hypothetical protein
LKAFWDNNARKEFVSVTTNVDASFLESGRFQNVDKVFSILDVRTGFASVILE